MGDLVPVKRAPIADSAAPLHPASELQMRPTVIGVPALGDSIGEIDGVIRAMLNLTRHSRVREQIRETTELSMP